MNTFPSSKYAPQNPLHKKIIQSLHKMAPPSNEGHFPPQSEWPSTRQIADTNDLSIYKARLLLLELVRKNQVMVSDQSVKHSLRWYPRSESESVI